MLFLNTVRVKTGLALVHTPPPVFAVFDSTRQSKISALEGASMRNAAPSPTVLNRNRQFRTVGDAFWMYMA